MCAEHRPGMYRIFWDFYGPDAQRTAEHFARHLQERLKGGAEEERELSTGVEQLSALQSAAWCDAPLALAQRLGRSMRAKRSSYQGPLPSAHDQGDNTEASG